MNGADMAMPDVAQPERRRPHKRLFPVEKHAHEPSSEIPDPADEVPLVQNTLLRSPPRDGAPHCGYDVCAPKWKGKFKHWDHGRVLRQAPGEMARTNDKEDTETNQEGGPEQWLQVPGCPSDS